MSERKLFPHEIDGLFLFCRKQKVTYYDVQLELVDHLGSSIEAIWKANPEISYTDALTKIYLSFGVKGFKKIEQVKKKELKKKYNRLICNYIAAFYRLPKIIITAILIFAFFFIFKSVSDLALLNVVLLTLLFTGLFIYYMVIYRRKIKIELTAKKSFLLLDYSNLMAVSVIGSIMVPFDIVLLFTSFPGILGYEMQMNNIAYFFLSVFYVFALVFVWVCWIYLPQRIKEDFTREYPQFVKP
jgi:hypothetical protein